MWSLLSQTLLQLSVTNWEQGTESLLSMASVWLVWSTACEYKKYTVLTLWCSLTVPVCLQLCISVSEAESWSGPQEILCGCWLQRLTQRAQLWQNVETHPALDPHRHPLSESESRRLKKFSALRQSTTAGETYCVYSPCVKTGFLFCCLLHSSQL